MLGAARGEIANKISFLAGFGPEEEPAGLSPGRGAGPGRPRRPPSTHDLGPDLGSYLLVAVHYLRILLLIVSLMPNNIVAVNRKQVDSIIALGASTRQNF